MNAGSWVYAWDYRNRLISAGNGVSTTTYGYDFKDQRVFAHTSMSLSPSTTTRTARRDSTRAMRPCPHCSPKLRARKARRVIDYSNVWILALHSGQPESNPRSVWQLPQKYLSQCSQ
jgi:hypothetical protein